MTLLNTVFSHFIGCDVGKSEIVIHNSFDGSTTSLPNRAKSLRAFAAKLPANCLVICEATGGYETLLLDTLLNADIAAHRADARKVKAFIRSFGIRGKTDAIDARALAQYGRERADKLRLWKAVEAAQRELQGLVLLRDDLVKERVAHKNRLNAPGPASVKAMLRPVIECLSKQIGKIEAQMKVLTLANAKMASDGKILRGVQGVGPAVANGLQGLVPELGSLNRREIASLTGLAPFPNQSGSRERRRKTRAGRPVKSLLFMAALAASRAKAGLGAFYRRLLANGKTKMVALVALMRKIIVIANARLRDARLNA